MGLQLNSCDTQAELGGTQTVQPSIQITNLERSVVICTKHGGPSISETAALQGFSCTEESSAYM